MSEFRDLRLSVAQVAPEIQKASQNTSSMLPFRPTVLFLALYQGEDTGSQHNPYKEP